MLTEARHLPAVNPMTFHFRPVGHVFGVLDNPAVDVPAVTSALLDARVDLDDLGVYGCSDEVLALDSLVDERKACARVRRAVKSLGHSAAYGRLIEREIAAGHAVICVRVAQARGHEIAAMLRRHGAHDLAYADRRVWQPLSPVDRGGRLSA